MYEKERIQSVIMDGARLEVIATRTGEREWMLSVINTLGISSNWIEFFPSADEAIREGLEAIKAEGVEAFTDITGFDYLQE
jgi:hypothetical protein